MTRAIFHPADEGLLNYLIEDGMGIEPEYYLPTVPLVLINGADGIGTGSCCLGAADIRLEHCDSELQSCRHRRQYSTDDARRGARTDESVVQRLQGEARLGLADLRARSNVSKRTNTKSAGSLKRSTITPWRSPSCRSENGRRTSKRCSKK